MGWMWMWQSVIKGSSVGLSTAAFYQVSRCLPRFDDPL